MKQSDTEIFDNLIDEAIERMELLAIEEEPECWFLMPTPKTITTKRKDVIPVTMMMVRDIQNTESKRVMRVLLDTGASRTMINSKMLPKGATPTLIENSNFTTVAGSFQSKRQVYLNQIILPEFDKTRKIDGISAYVFDEPCAYDVIIGRDFLNKIPMIFDFSTGLMKWIDRSIPMKPNASMSLEMDYYDDDYEEEEDEENYAAEILDAKYEKANIAELVKELDHLNEAQQERLKTVLEKFPRLFDGGLGFYPHKQIHLELEEDAVPVHSRAYPVPKAHEDAFKRELEHLCKIGVLRKCGMTEWAAPTFIVPKKDGRVRWVSDFRQLNKVLKRKVYPLPIIQDILAKRSGYKYFTKLDLTMMYYSFELDEESKQLSTIVTPYGKYQYCRMAMGLKPSPDFAQSIIEEVLADLDVDAYIDDVAVFDDDYDTHLARLTLILQRLQENGFKVNPLKCEWAVQETDFLGYWLTPTGIRPWKKKIDAVLNMDRPRTVSQLRSFLGAVTYYRNMWPRRSHLLAPLTQLTGKSKFEWTPTCQTAFDEMKSIITADTLLTYPNHNLPFDVYTDASDYQMGAAIMQDNKIVAYWSKKLNDAQKNYSTMEKELLAVVYCLNEFRTMLLGAAITVWTDHKNLTFRTLNTQRVLRWRLSLEDFAPKFRYIEGKHNVLADAFSRLPRMDAPTEGKSKPGRGKIISFESLHSESESDLEDELGACRFKCCRKKLTADAFSIMDEPEILEAFLNYPALQDMPNPITMQNIQQHQFEDEGLNQLRQQSPEYFPVKEIQGRNVICFRRDPNADPGDWKIAIPADLVEPILRWYHRVLGHCGVNRLYDGVRAHFYFPNLKDRCAQLNCDTCQRNKALGAGFGELPSRNAPLLPWNEVAVDLIGPWRMSVQGVDVEFNALTCIDPVTNLVELILIHNKTAAHIAQQFENCWLSRYPRPNRCIHDNGGEFIGEAFQNLLQQAGIDDAPTTSRNPQANSICERMHQTVANVLRTLTDLQPPTNEQEAQQMVENALATAMHATRCAIHRTLGISPGALVYQRDMFLDLPIIADLVLLQEKRQAIIDENLRRQNLKQREFTYEVGQSVLVKTVDPNKMEPRAHGPYPIMQVFTNGTVAIQRAPHVLERINIRRILPYRI